jgi:predicted  nucleic acid-binding Zn-ribbon protein
VTPEERFERIEKTLERMAAHAEAHDDRLSRLERKCEFLADQQAQLTAGLAELRLYVEKVNATVDNLAIVTSTTFRALRITNATGTAEGVKRNDKAGNNDAIRTLERIEKAPIA